MIEQTKGEMELSAYKFKQYLGSVSREIQNRKLNNLNPSKSRGLDFSNPTSNPISKKGV